MVLVRKIPTVFFFGFLILISTAQPLFARGDGEIPYRFWGNFGVGPLKSTADQADPSLILSAAYQYNHHLFTVRYMYARNYCEIAGCKESVVQY